jgi:hypothetical protein
MFYREAIVCLHATKQFANRVTKLRRITGLTAVDLFLGAERSQASDDHVEYFPSVEGERLKREAVEKGRSTAIHVCFTALFLLNCLSQFFANHREFRWRFNAETHPTPGDPHHGDRDVGADQNSFADFST